MPSEQMILATMAEFEGFSKPKRDNLLAALLAHKVARTVDGVSVQMDPAFAKMLQPILQDELAREAMLEALMRLDKQDKKKSGWRRFFGG